MRVFAERNWRNIEQLTAGAWYHLTTSTPIVSQPGEESIGISSTTYTRYFYIEDVGRGGGGGIVSAGGTSDPSVKKVIVKYGWQGTTQGLSTLSGYLARRLNRSYIQTDWSGGRDTSGAVTTFTNQFTDAVNINASTTGSITIQGP